MLDDQETSIISFLMIQEKKTKHTYMQLNTRLKSGVQNLPA
jgi:hypothetical protein